MRLRSTLPYKALITSQKVAMFLRQSYVI